MTASWEQEKIMGCTCDPGFTGHDCAARICPKGDDPVTSYDQNGMEQYIHYVSATIADGGNPDLFGNIYLSYVDPYGATWTTKAIDATYGSSDQNSAFCGRVQAALRAVPQLALQDVTVSAIPVSDNTIIGYKATRTVDAVSNGGYTTADVTITTAADEYACKIVFPNAAGTSGLQNIIQCHKGAKSDAGSQPLVPVDSKTEATSCVTGEYVSASGAGVRKLTELATCSNRGLCDETTGDCQCFAGHRGLACETQEALV